MYQSQLEHGSPFKYANMMFIICYKLSSRGEVAGGVGVSRSSTIKHGDTQYVHSSRASEARYNTCQTDVHRMSVDLGSYVGGHFPT